MLWFFLFGQSPVTAEDSCNTGASHARQRTYLTLYLSLHSAHLLHLIIYYYYFGLGFVVGMVCSGLVWFGLNWFDLVVDMVWFVCIYVYMYVYVSVCVHVYVYMYVFNWFSTKQEVLNSTTAMLGHTLPKKTKGRVCANVIAVSDPKSPLFTIPPSL